MRLYEKLDLQTCPCLKRGCESISASGSLITRSRQLVQLNYSESFSPYVPQILRQLNPSKFHFTDGIRAAGGHNMRQDERVLRQ